MNKNGMHVVRHTGNHRIGNMGLALIKAVSECSLEGRNPGKVGRAVFTHEARHNRQVSVMKKVA